MKRVLSVVETYEILELTGSLSQNGRKEYSLLVRNYFGSKIYISLVPQEFTILIKDSEEKVIYEDTGAIHFEVHGPRWYRFLRWMGVFQ